MKSDINVVSERGVVFLRNQNADTKELIEFGTKLSVLTGSPESSGLHIHPLTEANSELGDQISVISSEKQKKGFAPVIDKLAEPSKFASNGWHADITFEPVPSDYALLKIHTLPPTGGDTVSVHFSLMYPCTTNIDINNDIVMGIRL
jgi:alpha-ketoglutarate-dependent taurine dioxygenase